MPEFATEADRKPLRMIASLFRRRTRPDIDRLYGAIMAAALSPAHYAQLGVPDTFEGRFECATLHMALALRRLGQLPPPAAEASQALVDRFFDGLDAAIRERGIGDVAVPRRMKTFMQAFYGRLNAYSAALSEGAAGPALAGALGRNLLEGAEPSAALVETVRALAARLELADLAALTDRSEAVFSAPKPGEQP